MPLLPEPYELMDFRDGDTITLKVLRLEFGQIPITPTQTGIEKVVEAVRLHVAPGSKDKGMDYWDATPKTLVAQLKGHFAGGANLGRNLRIIKVGRGVSARFRLETIPLTRA